MYLAGSRRKKTAEYFLFFFAKLRNIWKNDSTDAAKFQGICRNLSPLELVLREMMLKDFMLVDLEVM